MAKTQTLKDLVFAVEDRCGHAIRVLQGIDRVRYTDGADDLIDAAIQHVRGELDSLVQRAVEAR